MFPQDVMEVGLPDELWIQVFSFLSWRDKLSARCSCSRFKQLIDESCSLWRGFSVVLRDLSRYDRAFRCSLIRRQVSRVCLRAGKSRDLQRLCAWLPLLHVLRLDGWRDGRVRLQEVKRLQCLDHLSITSCSTPLLDLDFLLPLSQQLRQLSLCNVQFTCPAPHLLAGITQLTQLRSLQLHHDGSLKIPTLTEVLTQLLDLRTLSWTMINHKVLPQDFFSSTTVPAGGASLQLSDLQLLNYDAVVTPDILKPLTNLRSLSVFHLYSVPGPTCHLQTWLSSVQELVSLNVHGGHPLAAYANFLPASLLSLTLCVDLQPEDLQVVSSRAPHLQHLHLEPWSSSSKLVRLLPQLFPHLQSLAIRHLHVPDDDFLSLRELQHLHTLEILDSFHRPDPKDPSWVVDKPSPRLLQLISDLQKQTNQRVRVLTRAHKDFLNCNCV